MRFTELYTIVWADTGTPVPPIDECCDIMAFSTRQDAAYSAEDQAEQYDAGGRGIRVERIEIGDAADMDPVRFHRESQQDGRSLDLTTGQEG